MLKEIAAKKQEYFQRIWGKWQDNLEENMGENCQENKRRNLARKYGNDDFLDGPDERENILLQ